MDKLKLAASILCCPDCLTNLDETLTCRSCKRSLAPEQDGIIDALPISMKTASLDKDELQRGIESAGPTEKKDSIPLYEAAFHNEQAPYYDKLFSDPLPLGKYYQRLICRQVYSYVKGYDFVVDLCCGTGKSSLPLIARGQFVVGVDISREMLRSYAAKCAHKSVSEFLLLHADATNPPLRAQSCGALIVIGGLHHIPKQSDALKSWCQALRTDGMLLLHEPLKTGVTSPASRILANLYALADFDRVWKAVKRRVGMANGAPVSASDSLEHFTPYEQPFRSAQEVRSIIPEDMKTLVLRSQAALCGREFPPLLQGKLGAALAPLVLLLEDLLIKSRPESWDGDAILAVLQKNGKRDRH